MRLNPDASIKRLCFGSEKHELILIDGFLDDAQALLSFAVEGKAFEEDPGNYYPGVRKPLPSGYELAMIDVVRRAYGLALDAPVSPLLSALSLATKRGDELRPIQSIPHFDTSEEGQYGFVHYLCGERFGGTSFYRHRATAFEAITLCREAVYQKALSREATTKGVPRPGYISGDTLLFEQIFTVSARFNRAIIYPSNILHAGVIQGYDDISHNPLEGRLTATSFIRF